MNNPRQFIRMAAKLTQLFTIFSGIILLSNAEAKADLATVDSSSTSVNLIWTAPGDDGPNGVATQYDIRYSLSMINESNWSSVNQASGETSPQPAGTPESFTVSNLIPATTYYFAIKSADEANNWSSMSNVVSKTTTANQIPPSNVANLLAANPTSSSLYLSWTAPGADSNQGTASQYDIRYSTLNISDANWGGATQIHYEPTPLPAGAQQNITINGLSSSTTYYFAIKTADESLNWSGLSNIANGVTQPGQDQTAPGAILDLLIAQISGSSVTLSWTAPGDDAYGGTATVYDIRALDIVITEANWNQAVQINNEPLPHSAGTQEIFTINGLIPEITCYIAIKTADEVPNWSLISNCISGTTPDQTPPAAIDDLSAVTGENIGQVNINWTASGDDGSIGMASAYIVKAFSRTITEANWDSAITISNPPIPLGSGSPQNFVIVNLNPGQVYYIALKSVDNFANVSAISNVDSAEAKPFGGNNIDGLTGLPKEFDLGQNYPNPFNPTTSIEFSLPVASNVALVIYDSNGRKVATLVNDYFSAGIHTIHWNGQESSGRSIATGVYFYRLQTDSFDNTKKMVFLK